MRVIAGKKRSIPLATVPGKDTRPTTDRIKETLFNMINSDLADARFLDLFAGSGQIGIEALSRGAESACFVDSNRACERIIHENLKKTDLKGSAIVLCCDIKRAIERLCGSEPYDIIFMDPPYAMEAQEDIIRLLGERGLLAEGGLLIVEADADNSLEKDIGPLVYTKTKKYKTNAHIFYEL